MAVDVEFILRQDVLIGNFSCIEHRDVFIAKKNYRFISTHVF